jgi:hypothetical protein
MDKFMQEKLGVRVFEGGATRDLADNKPDIHRFLCPRVLDYYIKHYMMPHQETAAGKREADNWKGGFGTSTLMASLARHEFAVWQKWDNDELMSEAALQDLCGVVFNSMAMIREILEVRHDLR